MFIKKKEKSGVKEMVNKSFDKDYVEKDTTNVK